MNYEDKYDKVKNKFYLVFELIEKKEFIKLPSVWYDLMRYAKSGYLEGIDAGSENVLSILSTPFPKSRYWLEFLDMIKEGRIIPSKENIKKLTHENRGMW